MIGHLLALTLLPSITTTVAFHRHTRPFWGRIDTANNPVVQEHCESALGGCFGLMGVY
jgi:hypothetical protein